MLKSVLLPCCATPPHTRTQTQIDEVGEVVAEVGSPSGWGPVGLDAEHQATVMARIKQLAKEKGAEATQVGGPSTCCPVVQ